MAAVARARRRSGGRDWGLFQDGARPTRFVETYLVASWADHLAQHADRLTVGDARTEEVARALAAGPPVVSHLFPPAPGAARPVAPAVATPSPEPG